MTIIQQLTDILGTNNVLTGKEVSTRNTGFFNPAPTSAKAIVRPRTTEDVVKIVELCQRENQVLVPAGGCTGLAGGHTTDDSEVQISFELMNVIEEIDTINRTITVQAGVTLQAVQEAAMNAGFIYPVDFGGRGSATIGGTIATNAGGNSVLRYGMTREQVLGLEVVLADGQVMGAMSKLIKDNAGYSLKHLFIGSEGTLGLITRATLRLSPKNQSMNTAFLALKNFDFVNKLLNTLDTKLGGNLTSFEVMWPDFYDCVLQYGQNLTVPLPQGSAYYVLVETEGPAPEQDRVHFEEVLNCLLEDGTIIDAVIAETGVQRDALWAIRDSIEAILHYMPAGIAYDISLPLDSIENYLTTLKGELSKIDPNYKMVTFGHLGDNNVHIGLEINPQLDDFRMRQKEIVYHTLQNFQASISAEHGIGTDKLPFLHYCRSKIERQLMLNLRSTLDPKGIFNPRKVITKAD